MKTTPLSAPSRRSAFSLVEIMVVLAIVTAVMAVGTPYVFSSIQSASLTSAGDTLMQKISQAQQRALTENKVIGLEFYFYAKDGVEACHALRMVSIDAATNAATPLEEPVYWGDGRVVLVNGALSPLFASTPAADTGTAAHEPFKGLEATFHRVRFYPGGSTSLTIPLRQAYVTMVGSNRYQKEMTDPPPNYYTVQLDPVAGRSRSYRP